MKRFTLFLLLVFGAFFVQGQQAQQTTSYGANAGTQGGQNCFYGYSAGRITTGNMNCIFGRRSGDYFIFLTTTLFGQSEIGISKLKIISFDDDDHTQVIDIVTANSSSNPTDEMYFADTLVVDTIGFLRIKLDYVTDTPGEMVEFKVFTSEEGDTPIFTATDNTGSFQEFFLLGNAYQILIENGEQLFFKLYGEGSGDGQNLIAPEPDAMACTVYTQAGEKGPPVIVMDSSVQDGILESVYYCIPEEESVNIMITNDRDETISLKGIGSDGLFDEKYDDKIDIASGESEIISIPWDGFEKNIIYSLTCKFEGLEVGNVSFGIDCCLNSMSYDCENPEIQPITKVEEYIDLGCDEGGDFVTSYSNTSTELQAEKAICFLPGYVSEDHAV